MFGAILVSKSSISRVCAKACSILGAIRFIRTLHCIRYPLQAKQQQQTQQNIDFKLGKVKKKEEAKMIKHYMRDTLITRFIDTYI